MYAPFADPKTDFVFKRIFGAEPRKPLLIALLNDLLEFEGDRCIVEVQQLTKKQHVDVPELKLSILDVKCTDATGRSFVVKMQVLNVEGFEKHVVYDASKPYVMQLRNAEGYPAPGDVIGITICTFNLWTERDEHGRFKVPMLSRWRMQEQHSGVQGLPQVQYAFLELPKYEAGDAPSTSIDKWAYFFRETKNLDVMPPSLSEGPFCNALDVARRASFSAGEWEVYQRAKMAEQDARGALTLAMREGWLKGMREALLERKLEATRWALLRVLERRGIVVTEEERDKIAACADAATLDRWFDRAFTATVAAGVFA